MEAIYWIQRLGMVNTASWVFFGISCLALIIGIAVMVSNLFEYGKEDDGYMMGRKVIKISLWVLPVTLFLGIFVPSEKQLYAIYGIGGTIDYLKSNDTAKQIPDKVINALDAWVDKITPKEEEEGK